MHYDIQILECHLPDPWYRKPVGWAVTIILLGGCAGFVFGAAYFLTGWSVWSGVLFFAGVLMLAAVFITVDKYEHWTDDPCSLIIDKKMYREEEKQKAPFKSHSIVNDHILDVGAAREEARMLEEQAERERKEAELHEEQRFAALSEEEKIQEMLEKVELSIAQATTGNYILYAIKGKREHFDTKPIGLLTDEDKRDIAYDALVAGGWVEA